MKKQELADRLVAVHDEFGNLIRSLSEPEYERHPEGKWAAGEQLDHLYRSIRPVSLAYGLPLLLPGLLFGKRQGPSADFDTIVARYRQKLAEGAVATSAYIPRNIPFAARERAVRALEDSAETAAKRLMSRTEEQLDRYRLPHPLLGKLSFREMACFTIYHVGHHHRQTREHIGL